MEAPGSAGRARAPCRTGMAARGCEGGSVRFFCTAGNGMEPVLAAELRRKLEAEDVCQLPGKVLFSSSAGMDRVRELKSAERLFLLLKRDPPPLLPRPCSAAKAASVLQSRLLGARGQWTSAVMTWSRLQGELAEGRRTGADTRAASSLGEGQMEEEERESGGLRGGEDGEEAWSPEKKRKREDGGAEEQALEKSMKRKTEEDEEERRKFNSRGSEEEKKNKNTDHVMNAGGEDEEAPPSAPLSFRISCKCTGSVCRLLRSQEVSRVLGVGLSRLMGWKADLKNPQLEVSVYLSDDLCLLGIPLTRLPLAHRSYIKTTGLRSTVAWAMTSLAQIQPGFRVVDPMCGVGTILIEAAVENEAACFLGVDIDDGQLQKANENIEFAEMSNRIELLQASSLALPLPSASVHAVICDLPFGRKFGTKTNMAASLPVIVAEMERILCVGGSLVLLLSPQLSILLKKLLAQKDTGLTPQTGTQGCPSPPLHQGAKRSPALETDARTGQQLHLPPPLSSLRHQTTLRVSLGAIDGLIHKYVKTEA